jgi:hypothetical protein
MNARQWGRWWRLEGQTGLRAILHTTWDPIGPGLPADEYECVEGPLASLLSRDAGPSQIAMALTEHRVGHFGAQPDPAGDARAADEIVTWYRSAKPKAE